ncbi:hypothetical protein ETH_00040930, partial [Eimeria tenella]
MLPEGFSCFSLEAKTLESLLQAADVGSAAAAAKRQLQTDLGDLLPGQQARILLLPQVPAAAAAAAAGPGGGAAAAVEPGAAAASGAQPGPAAAAAADTQSAAAPAAAAAAAADSSTAYLLLRYSANDSSVIDLAFLLPNPSWMTIRDKTLLLLELGLRLAVLGRVEVFDAVNTAAADGC